MLILGALLFLAPASNGPTDRAPAAVSSSQCLGLEVSSEREKPHRVSADHLQRSTFSASRSLDLTLHVEIQGSLEGAHTLEFRLRTPRGFVYQSLAVAVSPAPGKPAVKATFPVAGTAVTTNSLYGRWTVEPLLDGVPCARARAFTLQP